MFAELGDQTLMNPALFWIIIRANIISYVATLVANTQTFPVKANYSFFLGKYPLLIFAILCAVFLSEEPLFHGQTFAKSVFQLVVDEIPILSRLITVLHGSCFAFSFSLSTLKKRRENSLRKYRFVLFIKW